MAPRLWSISLATLFGFHLYACADETTVSLLDPFQEGGSNAGQTSGAASTSGGGTSGTGGGASDFGGAGGTQGSRTALLVTDTNLLQVDIDMEQRLEGLGYVVTRAIQSDVSFSLAETFSLVVLGTSADAIGIGGALRDLPVPELILEPAIAAMQGLGELVTSSGSATANLGQALPPLTEGLADPMALCTAMPLRSGNSIAAPGVSLAEAEGAPGVSVWAYFPRGAFVGGRPLPAPRILLAALHPLNCQTAASYDLAERSVLFLEEK